MTYLFPYLSLAFALMITFFHYKQLKKKRDDLQATLIYFLFFFIFFTLIPLGLIFVSETNVPLFLKQVGFSTGRIKIGLLLTVVSIPISIVAGFIGSMDPKMKNQYPYSKKACTSLSSFISYEIFYFFLYYFSWEFVFRGMIFFSLLHSFDLITALSIQTIISTLYHIGHPHSEIFAALLAGFIFGLVAYFTHSFLYTFITHGFIGMSTDSFLYWRYYRKKI